MSATVSNLPVVLTSAGMVPQSPAVLNQQLISLVSGMVPGYTANLPGSLIEDLSSTAVGALILCDQARVDTVNSITPYGANAFLLLELGQIYGVPVGQDTNTSVYVVFTGTPGFPINSGFVVSDGTYQYVIQNGGIVGSPPPGLTYGTSQPLFAVAIQSGSWPVPAGIVTNILTSVPSPYVLSVSNPLPGTPSASAQTEEDYRSQVFRAGLASSQGMPRYLRTLLGQVPGVDPRLVGIKQQVNQWEIIVGGTGDPYLIGNAIYEALFDISNLTGSIMGVGSITQANPGVITTTLNHNYSNGQIVFVNGALGMTQINGQPLTVSVITSTSFSIGLNTSSFGVYTGGGVLTPNFRNQLVNISDYPDTYTIPFVLPPMQTVTMVVTWNTIQTNFVNPSGIATLAQTALANYVNSIPVGAVMNELELTAVFQEAIVTILPTELLTRLVFNVNINGIGVLPEPGTGIIAGDPESYFVISANQITVTQG